MLQATIWKSGFFDFLSEHVGMTVLHPGGYEATGKLAQMSRVYRDTNLLDLACGRGTSSYYLADRFGCRVTGIDRSRKSIHEARRNLKNRHLDGRIQFRIGDAADLPFDDEFFDVVIAQSLFFSAGDRTQDEILDQVWRVMKPGGMFGCIELGWLREPSAEAARDVATTLGGPGSATLPTFEERERQFTRHGFRHLVTIKNRMRVDVGSLMKDESLSTAMGIAWKTMTNPEIRARLSDIRRVFVQYRDDLQYGVFSLKKPAVTY